MRFSDSPNSLKSAGDFAANASMAQTLPTPSHLETTVAIAAQVIDELPPSMRRAPAWSDADFNAQRH